MNVGASDYCAPRLPLLHDWVISAASVQCAGHISLWCSATAFINLHRKPLKSKKAILFPKLVQCVSPQYSQYCVNGALKMHCCQTSNCRNTSLSNLTPFPQLCATIKTPDPVLHDEELNWRECYNDIEANAFLKRLMPKLGYHIHFFCSILCFINLYKWLLITQKCN